VKRTFPSDHNNVKTSKIQLLNNVKNLSDYPLVIVISAGATGLPWWIMYARDRIGLTMAGGCAGDGATQLYPFYQTGQLAGLVPGVKGGAEYETLIEEPGSAVRRMCPQTMGHMVIILFVILGNITFLIKKKRNKAKRNAI